MKSVCAIASFILVWLSTYFIASSCKRTIRGTDPTTGKSIVIRDYTNCGPSCKFRVNRNLVSWAFRACTIRTWIGAIFMVGAIGLFVTSYLWTSESTTN